MSKPHLLSSTGAAALGAKLSQVNAVSYYYTPFAADITSALKALHECAFIESGSFSAAMNSAIGSEIAGSRSFVVSSVPKSVEDMSLASYMRLPVVIANVSRPLGANSIKQDYSDVLALRDVGCLIFMPENNIELAESVVQAYKVSEDEKVMLPSVVNIDLPYFMESVELPNEAFARRFVGKLQLPFSLTKKPLYFSAPADDYSEYRKQQQKAMKNAAEAIEKSSHAWRKKFKRTLPLVENYRMEDAELVLVVSGFHSTTAKAAVNRLRNEGKKVGLLRLRVIRPWPEEEIRKALASAKKVAIFEQSVSLGATGVFYSGIKPLAAFCSDFISLGKYPNEKDFMDIFTRLDRSQKEEVVWL